MFSFQNLIMHLLSQRCLMLPNSESTHLLYHYRELNSILKKLLKLKKFIFKGEENLTMYFIFKTGLPNVVI